MNFKKIIASAVLSASLFTFGAADCIALDGSLFFSRGTFFHSPFSCLHVQK